jgi:hypothetical protein
LCSIKKQENIMATPNPNPAPAPTPDAPIDLHISILVSASNDLVSAAALLIALVADQNKQIGLLTSQNKDLQQKLLDETAHDADVQKALDDANKEIDALKKSSTIDPVAVQQSIDSTVTKLQDTVNSIKSALPSANIPTVPPLPNSGTPVNPVPNNPVPQPGTTTNAPTTTGGTTTVSPSGNPGNPAA